MLPRGNANAGGPIWNANVSMFKQRQAYGQVNINNNKKYLKINSFIKITKKILKIDDMLINFNKNCKLMLF
jgi:hypothetical protein